MNEKIIKTKIKVKDNLINVIRINNIDYISLTDLARYKNRDNTGSNNVNRALIRIFDVKGYKSTYNIQDGDVIVSKNVNDNISSEPLTVLRANYGKENVYSVNSVEKFVFDDLELSHIKIGAI